MVRGNRTRSRTGDPARRAVPPGRKLPGDALPGACRRASDRRVDRHGAGAGDRVHCGLSGRPKKLPYSAAAGMAAAAALYVRCGFQSLRLQEGCPPPPVSVPLTCNHGACHHWMRQRYGRVAGHRHQPPSSAPRGWPRTGARVRARDPILGGRRVLSSCH